MNDTARRLALAFVIAVSALFNAFVFATQPVRVWYDAVSYIRPAYELVRHHAFRGEDPIAYAVPLPGNDRIGTETLRTPGYPLFLAAILSLGLPLETAVVIQHLLAIALTAATFLVVDLLLHRRGAAIVAALLVATHPATLLFAHHWMSELVATAMVMAALLCTDRLLRTGAPAWAVTAGLLTGCTMLIRPIAIGWFVPLTLIVARYAPRRWIAAAMFFIAAIFLPIGWAARNYAVSGMAGISSAGGQHVLFYNAGGAMVLRDRPLWFRLSAVQQQSGFFDRLQRLQPRLLEQALAEARADGIDPRQASYAVLSRYYGRLGRRILLRHIPEAAALTVSALIEIFVYTYSRPASSQGPSALLPATLLCGVVIFAAACLGLAMLFREQPALALLLGATIAWFALPAASAAADVRFAIPFAPAYAIAAALGIDYLMTRRTS